MLDLRKLDIHEAKTTAEFNDVMSLHKTIWGIADLEVIPEHILIAVQKNNGLVLCAYYENRPVGFSFGFCGITDQAKPYFYSHNLGVIPEYQNSGVGFYIKLKQREMILSKAINLVTWTFDPLESRNAYFNMKLGCIVSKYVEDYYGSMPDQLNSNIPSDRLIAEWWIESKHTIQSLNNEITISEPTCDQVVNSTYIRDNFIAPESINFNLLRSRDPIYVRIPSNYQEMRQSDRPLALRWRMHLRDAFEMCFESGKLVNGFYHNNKSSYYRLGDRENS